MAPLSARATPTHRSRLMRRIRPAGALGIEDNTFLARSVERARGFAQAMRRGWPEHHMSSNEPSSSTPETEPTVRVMRWIFTRADRRLTCELSLADDHACYELRTSRSGGSGDPALERFVDVTTAFERQSVIEGTLVNDGWSLESYESVLERRTAGAT